MEKIPGIKYIATLSKRYDSRTRICAHPQKGIIVIHPNQRPVRITPKGKIEEIKS